MTYSHHSHEIARGKTESIPCVLYKNVHAKTPATIQLGDAVTAWLSDKHSGPLMTPVTVDLTAANTDLSKARVIVIFTQADTQNVRKGKCLLVVEHKGTPYPIGVVDVKVY